MVAVGQQPTGGTWWPGRARAGSGRSRAPRPAGRPPRRIGAGSAVSPSQRVFDRDVAGAAPCRYPMKSTRSSPWRSSLYPSARRSRRYSFAVPARSTVPAPRCHSRAHRAPPATAAPAPQRGVVDLRIDARWSPRCGAAAPARSRSIPHRRAASRSPRCAATGARPSLGQPGTCRRHERPATPLASAPATARRHR